MKTWIPSFPVAVGATLLCGCARDVETLMQARAAELGRHAVRLLSTSSTDDGKLESFRHLHWKAVGTRSFGARRSVRLNGDKMLELLLEAIVQNAGTELGGKMARCMYHTLWRLDARTWRVLMRHEEKLLRAVGEGRLRGAAGVLVRIKSEQALPVFQELLARPEVDLEAKRMVIRCLSSYQTAQADAALLEAAKKLQGELRTYAYVRLLLSADRSAAMEALHEFESTPSKEARLELAKAINNVSCDVYRFVEKWREELGKSAVEVVESRREKGEIGAQEHSRLQKVLSQW